jgi:methionyl-tRNA formyltransferase
MEKLRIVFMGTPDFAVGILDEIYQANYTIVGVITAPDKPAGRGQKVSISAVKKYALEKNLTLLQPTNLKSETFLAELKNLEANVQVVVAFRMLPEAVWKMPKYGTFNLHASLLPDYRGAAPINWAIINGETQTGVTTFFIDEKIDTGAIIYNDTTDILLNELAGELHDKLMNLGKKTVLKTLDSIEKQDVKIILQDKNKHFKQAYKLNKENCQINWQKTGAEIHNLIRGLSPYPAAWTIFTDETNEWNVKIYETIFEKSLHNFEAGTILLDKKELKIASKDGYLNVLSLQFPGKKRLQTVDFLNGFIKPAKFYAK